MNHRWVLASPSLLRALVFSLLLHALVFLGIELGRLLGWWHPSYSFFRRPIVRTEEPPERIEVEFNPKPKSEASLTFAEVTPSQATAEAPPAPKYYSDRNSRAANPDTTIDSNIPKVTGVQDKVPKTVSTPRIVTPPAAPLQAQDKKPEIVSQPPAPSPDKPAKPPDQPTEKLVAKLEPETPGESLLAKASPTASPTKNFNSAEPLVPSLVPENRPKARPRRLAFVQPPDTQSIIAGEKIKQTGGVRRFGVESSLDVRSTEFGAYDAAIIAAIQKRWYDLLEEHLPINEIGKVVLEFRLTSKGNIENLTQPESGVSSLLGLMCERAVREPQPYGEWPPELRRLVGREYREVRFVFYYN